MTEKKIIAYHDCFVFQQRFVIYEDLTTSMFCLPFQSNRLDYFSPSEKEFNRLMYSIFLRATKNPCPSCGNMGSVAKDLMLSPCPECGGTGMVDKNA